MLVLGCTAARFFEMYFSIACEFHAGETGKKYFELGLALLAGVRVLDDVESGKTVLKLMKKWEISQRTMYNIKRHPDKIRTQSVQQRSKERKRVRRRKFDYIERDLFRQYKDARKSHSVLPISGMWLKKKLEISSSETPNFHEKAIESNMYLGKSRKLERSMSLRTSWQRKRYHCYKMLGFG